MQGDPIPPQVTPSHTNKMEPERNAAKKPPTVPPEEPKQNQKYTESLVISKSSDNTRDRNEAISRNMPKNKARHNPQEHPTTEDSNTAAVPQKKDPIPPSTETITFKRMEGGTELWNSKFKQPRKHTRSTPMTSTDAQSAANSIVQAMATHKGLNMTDVQACLVAASNPENWMQLMPLCTHSNHPLPKNIDEGSTKWIKGTGIRLAKASPKLLTDQDLKDKKEFKLIKSPLHAMYSAARTLWGYPWTRWKGEEQPQNSTTTTPPKATNHGKRVVLPANNTGGWKTVPTNNNKSKAVEPITDKRIWIE